MKKVYFFFSFISFVFFFPINANALDLSEKYDLVYSTLQKGEIRKEDDRPWAKPKKIKNTISPYKLKYCKLKDGTTYTNLSHQGCNYWDNDTIKNRPSSNTLSTIKGKKIKKKEYLNLNSDFSDKTNLVCVYNTRGNRYLIAYITHTPSNKVYLNSLVNVRIDDFENEYLLYGDDIKQRKKWRHQGTSSWEYGTYRITFYGYIGKDMPYPYSSGPPKLSFKPDNVKYKYRCFAEDKYWTAMYSDTKQTKNTEIVKTKEETQNKQKDKEKEKQIVKENNTTFASSTSEIGVYENIVYPLEMKNKLGNRDPSRVAGIEVSFRFIKKKSTLSKYPNKLMEAMAWMEVLYNEKIKYQQKVKFDDVKGLLEARNSMRESVGLDINVSAQDAIDTYWVMSILLSKTKYEKRDVDPALLERKKALNDLKTALRKAKEKYLEEVQGDKS